jgi:hypothetical protein
METLVFKDTEVAQMHLQPVQSPFLVGDEVECWQSGYKFIGIVDAVFKDNTMSINESWERCKCSFHFNQCKLLKRTIPHVIKCACGELSTNDYRWQGLKLLLRVGCPPCQKWSDDFEYDFAEAFAQLRDMWEQMGVKQ